MHPQAINKCLISVHANVSCTMIVEGEWAKFWHVHSILADSKAVARQVPTLILQEKMKKSCGGGGGVVMGSKIGKAHALGCPYWVPSGAGSREYVLGTLCWFLCPRVQIHTIRADTDKYLHIHTYTCIYLSNTH